MSLFHVGPRGNSVLFNVDFKEFSINLERLKSDCFASARSDSGEAGKMDFENIATHELGHSVGLGDLYTDACSEQTMYGYADNGETKKRTLEAGDIKGVQELYAN
jgi:hypothetical protein